MKTFHNRSELDPDQGVGRIGALIWVLIFVLGFYAAWQVLPFYYYSQELQGIMDSQVAKAQVFSDAEIRKNVMEKINKLEIPIDDPEDLKINRFGGRIVIELEYSEILTFDWFDKTYDIWTFNFHPRAEGVAP